MDADFERRIAIVTGGAGGIGRALARAMCERGAEVVLADLRGSDAKAAANELRKEGYLATGVALDVTDPEAFKDLALAIQQRSGRIDFLFNNAGVAIVGEVRDFLIEDWHQILDVNLRGVAHGVHAVYPIMINQGHGHIINIASLSGLLPAPMLTAYSASKWGVVGLSLGLRAEASDLGVKVTCICPGFVDTALLKAERRTPTDDADIDEQIEKLGRISPEQCADATIRGILKNKAIVTVPKAAGAMWRLQRMMPSAGEAGARYAIRRLRGKAENQ